LQTRLQLLNNLYFMEYCEPIDQYLVKKKMTKEFAKNDRKPQVKCNKAFTPKNENFTSWKRAREPSQITSTVFLVNKSLHCPEQLRPVLRTVPRVLFLLSTPTKTPNNYTLAPLPAFAFFNLLQFIASFKPNNSKTTEPAEKPARLIETTPA
jgi:hypothetical protein